MHRRIIYTALAFVAAAPGDAVLASVSQLPVTVTKTVIYQSNIVPPPAETLAVAVEEPVGRAGIPPSSQLINKTVIYEDCTSFLLTPPTPANLAVGTTSGQLVNRTVIYEDRPNFVFTPVAAEEVTVDKWWQEPDQPVRLKRVTAEEGSCFSSPPTPQGNDLTASWHRQLDWPTRLKRVTAEEGSLFASPPKAEASDAIGWHIALSEPLRIIRSLITDVGYGYFTPAEAEEVTVDKWWQEPDQPVRKKPVTAEEGSHFAAPAQPEANDAIGWHKALDEPLRLKRLSRGGYQFEARSLLPEVPWGWYAQLDRVHPLKRVSTGQVSLQFVAAAPGSGVEYNWFQSIDWPTRARKLYEFPATSIPVFFAPPIPGAGNEYNWFQPLDEPVRPRRSIRTAQQWPLTIAPRLVTATLENGWYQKLSEPVRLKVTFGKYPGGTAGNIDPIVPLVWSLVDEPRRTKRVTRTVLAQDPFPVAPAEVITIDKWWQELVRPTRIRPRPHQQGYTFVAAAPGLGVAYNWFQPLDTPVRLPDVWQTDLTYGYFTPVVVEVAGVDGWIAPTSQVVSRTVIYDDIAYGYFTPQPVVAPVVPAAVTAQIVSRTVVYEDRPTYVQFILAAPGAGTEYNWFQALDWPTRRIRSRAVYQKSASYGEFTPARAFYVAATTSAQVFRRAFIFDPTAIPPLGVDLPNAFQQTVTINVTVAFGRMLRYSCKAEATDDTSEEAEQGDSWVTQAEQSVLVVDESELSDPWSTETEETDTSDEQDEEPGSGCP